MFESFDKLRTSFLKIMILKIDFKLKIKNYEYIDF